MNHASNTGRHRILVIANETAEGNRLHETVCALAPAAEVLVISPALNSRIRHWVSDEDGARRAAARRLEASVQRLRRAGLDARGDIGDADPLQAIRDALSTFAADEIVISTHPKGRSNWLAKDLVERARNDFEQPVVHVTADEKTSDPQLQHAA